MPDQSQKAAIPTTRISVAELVRGLSGGPRSNSLAKEENQKRAADQLSMIEELQKSSAFKWFFAEFVDKPYRDAFEKLRSPYTEFADLPKVQTTYTALAAVRRGLLEREIVHREQLQPDDPALPALRDKLRNL